MSFDSLLVHTVTIVEPGGSTNRYGDDDPDWTATTEVVTPARVVQRTATEILENRDADITEWVAYVPGDVDASNRAHIEWDGLTFEVAGDPKPAVRRTAVVHHREIPLRRIEG